MFICPRLCESPQLINESALHFLLFTAVLGARAGENTIQMEKRKVEFYVYENPDIGFMDCPDQTAFNPSEKNTGYFIGIVNEKYEESKNLIAISKILIESEDGLISLILPEQLIRFLEK